MTTNFEADWAKAMTKTKQTDTVSQLDPAIQKKQIKEELDYFKQKLWKALEQKDQESVKDTLKKLIKTRGRLLKIKLVQKRGIDKQKELEKYYYDCFSLREIVGNLLNK